MRPDATAPQERLRITSTGDVIIGSGNGSPQLSKTIKCSGSSGSIISIFNGIPQPTAN